MKLSHGEETMTRPKTMPRALCWGAIFIALGAGLGFLGRALSEEMDLFDVLGENHRFGSRMETAVRPGGVIEIRNAFGAVDVAAGEDGRITVDIEKIVRAARREQAGILAEELRFTTEEDGGVLRIVSNREELPVWARQRLRSDLSVRVPRESSVRVLTEGGRVHVAGLAGAVEIETAYRDVTVRDVSGPIVVANRHGDVLVEAAAAERVAVRGDHVNTVVVLPRNAGFSLHLAAGEGDFESDFDAFPGRPRGEQPVEGRVGAGGPHLEIQVRQGDVRVVESR